MDKLIASAISEINQQITDTYGTQDTEESKDLSEFVTTVAKRAMIPIAEFARREQAKAIPSEEEIVVDLGGEERTQPAPKPNTEKHQAGSDIEARMSRLESKLDQVIRLLGQQSRPVTQTKPNAVVSETPNVSQPYVPTSASVATPVPQASFWGPYQKAWFNWKNAQPEKPPTHNGQRSKMCSADYQGFKLLSLEQKEEFLRTWA